MQVLEHLHSHLQWRLRSWLLWIQMVCFSPSGIGLFCSLHLLFQQSLLCLPYHSQLRVHIIIMLHKPGAFSRDVGRRIDEQRG